MHIHIDMKKHMKPRFQHGKGAFQKDRIHVARPPCNKTVTSDKSRKSEMVQCPKEVRLSLWGRPKSHDITQSR